MKASEHCLDRQLQGLLFLSILLVMIGCRQPEIYATQADALKKISEYEKRKDYGNAVKTGEGWLRINPDDAEMHGIVALVYLEQAGTEKVEQKKIIDSALHHADEALRLEPTATRILEAVADSYKLAADISPIDRCPRYQKALDLMGKAVVIVKERLKNAPGTQWDQVEGLYKRKSGKIQAKIAEFQCR